MMHICPVEVAAALLMIPGLKWLWHCCHDTIKAWKCGHDKEKNDSGSSKGDQGNE